MRRLKLRSLAVVAVLVVAAACGGGDDAARVDETTSPEATEVTTTTADDDDGTETGGDETETGGDETEDDGEATTTTAGSAIADPDDDTNGDGILDPFCGQVDYGGGLVLQVHCDLEGLTAEIPEGVTLVPGSLLSLRSSIHRDLTDISGNLVVSRAPDGRRVAVLVFQSDVLFASGSSELTEGAAANFAGVINFVAANFPGSAVQVRGHTDGVGDPGSNQPLSEARAAAVQTYLLDNGVSASEVTAIGFGETQPLAVEDTEDGKAMNRRVEVVLRPPGE